MFRNVALANETLAPPSSRLLSRLRPRGYAGVDSLGILGELTQSR